MAHPCEIMWTKHLGWNSPDDAADDFGSEPCACVHLSRIQTFVCVLRTPCASPADMLCGAAVYSFGVLMWHLFTCQVVVVAPLGSCENNWSSMYLLLIVLASAHGL